jgi:alcohol dehydrogenase class IV
VLRWNESTTAERQRDLATAIGRPNMRLGDAVVELIAELGLPARLRDVNVREDQLAAIADEAAKHPTVLANPRKITNSGDIMEVLRAAW